MKASMQTNDFPPFVVDMIIRRIRIRHYHFRVNPERRREFLKERTWWKCIANNKNKLLRMHFDQTLENRKREINLWKPLIQHQKKKLMKIYDLYTAWQDIEYKILERMNKRNFPKTHGALWAEACRRQLQKIERRVVRRGKYQYNPKEFIKRQRNKLKRVYRRKAVDFETEAWNRCAIAAAVKMNSRYGYAWDRTINTQINKLDKLYSKEVVSRAE